MGDDVAGVNGSNSSFSSITATGGYASVNNQGLANDSRGGDKAAWGGNSGNGNSGWLWWCTLIVVNVMLVEVEDH